jgi:hypothetical protein
MKLVGVWWTLAFPFLSLFGAGRSEQAGLEWWEDLSLLIHRNGEADACGSVVTVPNAQTLGNSASASIGDKYEMESFLTDLVADTMEDESSCGSPENANANTKAPQGILGFCDMGPDRTPILLDHEQLIPVKSGSLPCRWYTREGLRISSLEQLKSLVEQATSKTCNAGSDSCAGSRSSSDPEIHLYGVPAGRVFMFAPSFVGEIFDLTHVLERPDPDLPVYMKVLSTNPRVFDVVNVFSKPEADAVVRRALQETSPSHRMHRSTTGTSENAIFTKRTSENAFDTHGMTAVALKQ